MKKGEEFKVNILKVVNGGQGLAKVDNFVVFIKNALPGEYIQIKIIKVNKSFAIGEIVKILNPNIGRKDPDCKYFYECGGCQLLHCNYKTQLKIKEEIARESLEIFAKDIHEIVPCDSEFNYRNKITYRKKNNVTGLYKEKTNDIVHVEWCKIANKKINFLYSVLEKIKCGKEEFKFVLRSNSSGDVMLVSEKDMHIDPYLIKEFTSVYYNRRLVHGKEYIIEEINGIEFPIYPNSFFQVNINILKKMIHFLKLNMKGKTLIDSYCGTGVFSFSLRNNYDKIIGIDIERDNIKSAHEIKKKYEVSNVEFYTGAVKNIIENFHKADTILVDPPRTGCSKEVIYGIIQSKVEKVIYISCDVATLKRDLSMLTDYYKIDKIKTFDMFPGTYHFETVCFLNII